MERPVTVECSTIPKITASTTKIAMVSGIWVCGSGSTPMLVYVAGKVDTVLAPSRMRATPRYSARVPIVTASEGRPTRVTSSPLIRPATIPSSATTTKMASIGQWWLHRTPSSALDMPRIEATDRSISPLMTISVIGSAMIAISPEVTPVLKKLPLVRNWGEVTAPKTMMATTRRPRPVSQRTEPRAAERSQPASSGAASGSAGAAAGTEARMFGSGSNAGTPSPQCGHEAHRDDPVERDGQQEEEAGDGLQPELRESQHVQRRVDAGQQQRADGRTDRAPAPAEDGHPAHHHRGDNGQLVAGPRRRVDRLVLRGPQHPGHPGDSPARGERGEDPPADRDGGQPGGLRVGADRVQLAAGPERSHVVGADRDDHGDRDGQVGDARHGGAGDIGERVRQGLGGHLVTAHDEDVDAPDDVQRGQRDHQARHPAHRDHEAVGHPAGQPDAQADQEDQRDRDAGVMAEHRG